MERKNHSIMSDVLDDIGQTPLIRINKITKEEGIECDLLAKCEYRNPGGSLKDRVVMKMIREAEKAGKLRPGMTIIEPSSGNTGISVAMAGAVLGYRTIICITDKMSKEKVDIMAALGAIVIRASRLAHEHSPDSHINLAFRIHELIPDSFVLNQYFNENNPLAHYEGTAQEIIDQCGGKLDVVVVGAGTCGTLTGVARRMRDFNPDIKVIGVDPMGSLLDPDSDPKCKDPFLVEGIGHKFLPGVLDRSVVDSWIKIRDPESFDMARRIIRSEGLLVGGSSGAIMCAAVRIAKTLRKDQRCVVILPDGIRNYLTHFVSDEWMDRNGFMFSEVPNQLWRRNEVTGAPMLTPLTTPTLAMSTEHGVHEMQTAGAKLMVIQDESGHCKGIVTLGNTKYLLKSNKTTPQTPLFDIMFPSFGVIRENETLSEVADSFKKYPFVVVVRKESSSSGGAVHVKDIMGIIDPDCLFQAINNQLVD